MTMSAPYLSRLPGSLDDNGSRQRGLSLVGAAPFGSSCPTLFHEEWWLDLATGGRWQAAKHFENKSLVGWMPYFVAKSIGGNIIKMPPLTHCLGPVLTSLGANHRGSFRKSHSVTNALIGQLPTFGSFHQKFHREIGNGIAFQQNGFSISIQYTFILDQPNVEDVWKNLRAETRNQIRAAGKALDVASDLDASSFLQFHNANQIARGREVIGEQATSLALMTEALTRNKAKSYYAVARDGKIAAAILTLSDDRTVYYSLSARATDAFSGAIPLLIWQAIRDALEAGKAFDFEGIGYHGAIKLYSGFDPKIASRLLVTKSNKMLGVYKELKKSFRPSGSCFG